MKPLIQASCLVPEWGSYLIWEYFRGFLGPASTAVSQDV